MRKRIFIKDFFSTAKTGEEYYICGWVRTRRDSRGGFSFIEINDGSCMANLQIVADNSLENYEKDILKLHPGSSLGCVGIVAEGSKKQLEIHSKEIHVFGFSDPETYAIGKQRVSFEKLREIAHLRPRTNTFGAVCRVRNCLAHAVHRFFHEKGFVLVHTPIITASDCEGAGQMFQVTTLDLHNLPRSGANYTLDFFKKPAFLTVSGQLEGETHACALGNIYTFGPTFRAENSNTPRHLAEFWMIEPEMAFADLDDDAELAEKFIKYLIHAVLNECAEDLAFFDQRIEPGIIRALTKTAEETFERITYTDAVRMLENSGTTFTYPPSWGSDLQTEHEKYPTEKGIGRPVIVTDYPESIKAFYMKSNPDRKTVRAMDVLVPRLGEIIGGSQREDDLERLEKKMAAHKLDKDRYWWYCDLRRYGSVPHAGFGLGFERMVQFTTGMTNIRDVIPFPRTPGNAEF